MSSSRISFGSRAGGQFDYNGGQHDVPIRSTTHSGAYNTLDALADALRTEIAAAAEGDEPECTTLELSLSAAAPLELIRPGVGPYAEGGDHDLPPEFKHIEGEGEQEEDRNTEAGAAAYRHRHPRALVGNIVNVHDGQQSAIVQRAASRGVIQAIQNADGFRYSFNNAWTAKDGEGSRFSYICQDSMQNKDRHANGYPRTTKHLKGDIGSRGPRKPTYDCKGSVSIKFSTTKQRCDVFYRHYAIHSTVADRAQVQRPPAVRRPFVSRGDFVPQSVDHVSMEDGNGGLLATLHAESYASSALAMVDRNEHSNIGRPLKRKRESGPSASKSNPNKPLSLVELLSQSESAKASPSAGESNNNKQTPSNRPAPIAYDLPSWQTPPPPLNVNNQGLGGAVAGHPAPYPPPYQPTRNRMPSAPSASQPHLQQTKQHQPTFQQKSSGQAARNHPQAQGLFTTLKPVGNPTQPGSTGTMYAPPATMYQDPAPAPSPSHDYETMQTYRRAKISCVRCRQGQRKCDQGQPCTACIRGGLGALECVYEGGSPFHYSDPTSSRTGGNRLPWTAHDKPSPLPVDTGSTYPQSSSASPVMQLPWGSRVSLTNSTPAMSSQAWRPPATLASVGGARRAPSPDPWFPKR